MIKISSTLSCAIVLLVLLSTTTFSIEPGQNSETVDKNEEKGSHNNKIDLEKYHQFQNQIVTINDFNAEGYILAIGGGGEGVIGQIKGKQVVAIDISKRELEGSHPGPLKIIMDATDLKFLDDTFNTAASFFTLCYINGNDHEKVLSEVFRVLAPNGKFLIWDMTLPRREEKTKNKAIFPLLVKLPHKEISTGYGVDWPEEGHDLAYFAKLSEKVGFQIVTQQEKDQWFFLEIRKP